ncbi:RNA editing ligase [Trypanosoma rangeli]|uniref:RNA ligase (ATP) n=1 Tax=Trypanosoma rangeli TaxID=5698 RepID=A0A3R7NWI2_TRYRA|nr:RNA editing ligase [Trypanosoma rangeli]RNF08815.1 RNA editing ligase [Trypanosoma rangeli]|eukprot:RNF08815.1 RNA editing ligase [Trypanosoma rangeli]
MLRRCVRLHFSRTPLWLADDVVSLFERYTEIENSNERRISALRACSMFDDEWIATEKVHGANFGIYSIDGGKMIRYAKRSGIMLPTEHFFGYHILIPQLQQYITATREMLCDKLQRKLHTVLINGELFGGKYDHPSLPKTRKTVMVAGKPRTISAVQTDSFPQYSPDLHFYAFDIKYKESVDAEYNTLMFDEATELFQKIPGLLYARAIIRGPMSKVAAFDVEHFVTTIPPLVGMGNYPLKGNWAEGLVVKHAKRGKPGFDPKGLTILKFKCTAFQEISTDRRQGPRVDEMEVVRRDSISRSGVQLPDLESVIHDPVQLDASKFLLDHVCENRLNAVLSKIGTDPFEKEEMTPDALATLLAKDALKDFLKEAEPAIVNTPILTRRDMARYVLFESRRLVCSRWKTILQRQTPDVVG